LLGRYEILAPIAAGGMARVWAARLRGSRGFSKVVAVKTMRPDVSDDVRFEKMFLDEARIASRIRHGNVVSILDLGEQDELLYLVMEYIEGESLDFVRRKAAAAGHEHGLPLPLALRIISDSAAGLEAAHRLCDDDGKPVGLVHRDVSPHNILISYDGSVKVTDFGVAKAAGRVSQTTDGTLKGKPAFMAPEQLQSAAVDGRADVFALGIVLYQLVCGLHPFRGENDIATVSNILSRRPIRPPSAVRAGLEPRLDAIVEKALQRDPEKRFQSAAELEHALDDLMRRTRRARDDQIAGLMNELCGERRRSRRQEIERATALADQRASERASLTPPPSAVSSVAPSPSAAGTPLAYAARAPARAGRRWLAGGLLLGAIAALAILLASFASRREQGDRAAPAPASTPTAAAAAAPVEPTAVATPSSSASPEPRARPLPAGRRLRLPAPGATSAEPPAPAPPGPAPVPVMEPGF
jgi:eukaryotic-like serine/threonine-protein kinase